MSRAERVVSRLVAAAIFLVVVRAGLPPPKARAQEAEPSTSPIAVPAGPVTLGVLVPDAPEPAASVVVAEAPPPGRPVFVSRASMARALRRAGVVATAVVLPRGVRIALRTRRLARAELAELVAPVVAASARSARVVVRELPASIEIPEGEVAVELDPTADSAAPRCSGSGACRVATRIAIVVSGLTVRRLAVVTERVAEAPAVARGAEVRIVVRAGNVVIRTPGRALESGATGDVVRVENLAMHRAVSARIVDSRTVEVEP